MREKGVRDPKQTLGSGYKILIFPKSLQKFKKEETLKLFLWNTGIFLLERFFYKFFRFF